MAAIRLSLLLGALLACGSAIAVDRLDPRDFATEMAVCSDLYQFANGAWLKHTPVPALASRINRFTQLQRAVREQRLALLRAILADPRDPLDQAIAQLARSALDETLLRGARETALAALLPAIEQLQQREQVAELLRAYQVRGIPVALRFAAGSAERALRIEVQPIGLPDPGFHTRQDSPTREWLGRYRAYVETLLPLVGSTDAAVDAAWAIDLETRLAQSMAPTAAPEILTPRELDRRFPGLGLRQLLREMGLQQVRSIELEGAAPLAALERLIAEQHPVQWRAWLRLRLAHLLAPYLDAPFREPWERFFRRDLQGDMPAPGAEARALEIVEHWLGEAFTQRYVDSHFDAARQTAASDLIDALRSQLGTLLATQPLWQDDTRAAALRKLQALRIDSGVPAARPHIGVALDPGTLVGNVLALNRWQPRHARAFAPGGRRAALEPQLGYQREENRLVTSPALWQAPLFDPGAEPALRFGGIGALIAHELSHGFDLGGASFDHTGQPRPWWSEQERAAWIAASAALIAQYDAYLGIGGQPLDGARLQAENLADLTGLKVAWLAFSATQADLALPLQHALTPAQRFFVAWASLWRESASDDARRAELQHAAQAPARFRGIGPLPHLAGFAEAFGCAPGQPMLQTPAVLQLWATTASPTP
jgi:putative endopeptidase